MVNINNFDSGGGSGSRKPTPGSESPVPANPAERIGFEIEPQSAVWSFAPTYYPDSFVQNKDREVERDGKQCGGESVTIKNVKNREFHVKGALLAWEIPVFQRLLEHDGTVDLISPLTPSGGMECKIKDTELGDLDGYDPIERAWRFEYSIDLVSTGRDEHDDGHNDIVSAIIGSSAGGSSAARGVATGSQKALFENR